MPLTKEQLKRNKSEYMKRYRQQVTRCPICECTIRLCSKARHEQSNNHIATMVKKGLFKQVAAPNNCNAHEDENQKNLLNDAS